MMNALCKFWLIVMSCNFVIGFLWRRPFGCSVIHKSKNLIPKRSFVLFEHRWRFDGIQSVPDGPEGEFEDSFNTNLEAVERAKSIDIDSIAYIVDPNKEDVPYDDPVEEKMRQEERYLPDEVIYLDDLKAIWSEYCEVNGVNAEPECTFAIEKVLPLIMKDNEILRIEENRPKREVRLLPVYWGKQDLRKLWDEWKPDPPELKSENYSSYEAWALVPDQNTSDPEVHIITENVSF